KPAQQRPPGAAGRGDGGVQRAAGLRDGQQLGADPVHAGRGGRRRVLGPFSGGGGERVTIRSDSLLLVLGLAAVTYLPRALPAVLIEKLHFGPKLEKFLQLIPYTAMAALICPGIFTVDAVHPAVGLLGGAAAGVL